MRKTVASKRMIYFDDGIWSELEKIKLSNGVPISRMLEKGAKSLLEKSRI